MSTLTRLTPPRPVCKECSHPKSRHDAACTIGIVSGDLVAFAAQADELQGKIYALQQRLVAYRGHSTVTTLAQLAESHLRITASLLLAANIRINGK